MPVHFPLVPMSFLPVTLLVARSSQITIIFVFTNFCQAFVFRQWICLMFHFYAGLFTDFHIVVAVVVNIPPIKCLFALCCLVCLVLAHSSTSSVFGFIETKLHSDVFQTRSAARLPVVFHIRGILFRLNDIFHFSEHFTKENKLRIVCLCFVIQHFRSN